MEFTQHMSDAQYELQNLCLYILLPALWAKPTVKKPSTTLAVISPLRGNVLDSENKILPPPRIRTIYFLRRPVFRGQMWTWKKENVTQQAKIFNCAI